MGLWISLGIGTIILILLHACCRAAAKADSFIEKVYYAIKNDSLPTNSRKVG